MEAFNPFEFTSRVRELLSQSNITEAQELVTRTVEDGKLSKDHYRVKNALSIIRSVKQHLHKIDELVEANEDIKIVELHSIKSKQNLGIPNSISTKLNDGIYVSYLNNNLIKTTLNPILLDGSFDLQLLDFSGFNIKLNDIIVDKLYIDSNVRLSCLSPDSMTVINEEGGYHPDISGRVAKASFRNAYITNDANDLLEEAYILPFPHAVGNYYHNLCEIGYGFRYINRIRDDVPIIYMKDKFGIVEALSNMLNIDKSRMIEFSSLKTHLISKAYMPSICPFYWSSSMAVFFRNLCLSKFSHQSKPSAKKFYISRAKSSRSPSYEANLEEILQSKGYSIIHAQELSIENQIKIFSDAEEIVSHHGAGLANFIFSKNSIKIYEIFTNSMLAPDFYHRSKTITPFYRPIFGMNENNYHKLGDYL